MKKLNDKGFAISAVLYTLLTLILILMIVMLAVVGSRKTTINKVNEDVMSDINSERPSNDNGSNSNSNSNSDSNSNSNSNSNTKWQKFIIFDNYNNFASATTQNNDVSLRISSSYNYFWTDRTATINGGPAGAPNNYRNAVNLSGNIYYVCFKPLKNSNIYVAMGAGKNKAKGQITGTMPANNININANQNSMKTFDGRTNVEYCVKRTDKTLYVYAIYMIEK